MSRAGAKKGRRLPGAEFSWDADPGGEADTAPTPLFPKYSVPPARLLSAREQLQVDQYRELRERHHEGPYYSVLDVAASAARKGSAARAHFDPFHGMPSYSRRYQKKKRALPRLQGRTYVMKFFPRELWSTIQPSFKGDGAGLDFPVTKISFKRGFEDDDEEEEEDAAKRRRRTDGEEGEDDEAAERDEEADRELLEDDEDAEEEIVDDDFEEDDDEMGGDYNAEQYFDGGDDEYGEDGFGDGGGGGGGGDEDVY
ncbi:hypothetical protein ASPZODRAFT_60873 [Penicilliopsis zonata CBS 506.65]|uniref:DNA-directed RNA polymerase III subunit n=1 Tax=Penicilliopsis zonata CBS 506.65 TaxID=1073090 RepID=A0A1L9SNS2_9EURO|nr:hypothetical protein ASPZODRAFT_60873 [Penicilliopsis zonata CBS 506.65]OJJ48902.1 hypothetical protein ASPZODRAFT_60873 [Penicilliopsis zonata CBS 506.65]